MNCKARDQSEKNQQKSEGLPRDCNDTWQYMNMTIHDTWAQSGHDFGGRSQSDQKYIKDRNWSIWPIGSFRIVFGESPRNGMATTWEFWDHPSRLCSQDSWAWWGDLASQAKKCQCMHMLHMLYRITPFPGMTALNKIVIFDGRSDLATCC